MRRDQDTIAAGGAGLEPMPLHIDRPGAAPVAIDRLSLLSGLERPNDITSPVWAKVDVELANGDLHEGAIRVLPPQHVHGAPPLARVSGILVMRHGRLMDPMAARERLAAGLAARDVLPLKVLFREPAPHPLRIHQTPGRMLELEEWSRPLTAVDIVDDISRLPPL